MADINGISLQLRIVLSLLNELSGSLLKLIDLLEDTREIGGKRPRFLSEEQFAEFLGTTVAALRTRRFRKQIPEAIWVKEGRRTLYCVEAYEQWIQEQMQSSFDPIPCPQQKARKSKTLPKRGPGKRPYPLLV